MGLWSRIIRYLMIWALILLILVVMTVVLHWKDICSVMAAQASSLFSSILVIALIIGAIIYLIRSVFR